MTPIIEPLGKSHVKHYLSLIRKRKSFVLLVNSAEGKAVVDPTSLLGPLCMKSPRLKFGMTVVSKTKIEAIKKFLNKFAQYPKFFVIRANEEDNILHTLSDELNNHLRCTVVGFSHNIVHVQSTFPNTVRKIILHDGFRKKERNIDYPSFSEFNSALYVYKKNNLDGFGDFLMIGDHVPSPGGFKPRVVTLHLTVPLDGKVIIRHFSSTYRNHVAGDADRKFLQANESLVKSSEVARLPRTSGIESFLEWHASQAFPLLGVAKKASMKHHLEVMAHMTAGDVQRSDLFS